MNSRVLDIADLGFQVGDHVCAFYNEGGNSPNDIVLDYLSKGLHAGNKCVCFSFSDTASSVRDRIPDELIPREGILQFITDVKALLDEGNFSREALIDKMEAAVKEALSEGYERFWWIGDIALWLSALSETNGFPVKKWAAFESAVNEFVPRYPQFIMCMYDLDRFGGDMVMNVLQTHPRVFVNGIIIPNPHYVPTQQFLESLGTLPGLLCDRAPSPSGARCEVRVTQPSTSRRAAAIWSAAMPTRASSSWPDPRPGRSRTAR